MFNLDSSMPDTNDKQTLAVDAWKVVGSPARRASINPENAYEMNELHDFTARARALSIPGFAFQVDSEGPPPPGFSNGVETSFAIPSIWANGSPVVIIVN